MEESKLEIGRKYAFDKVNASLAGAVFLISFIIYYLTKAPTFSFWDCGEFVACSYILGIPHPPGSPLYILAGRVVSILPIAADIAVRLNLFSVVTSSVSALFGYLVTVRLIKFWYEDRENIYNRIIIYIGGFTGALFMAFSGTNWANSVEAEVYSPTIMIMMIILWLALKYFENKETPRGTKYVLLIGYLAMLGVGIHLTLFLIVPVIGLFFILKREAGVREWAIVSLFFLTELYLIFQLSSQAGEVPFYIPILILFIIFLFHTVLLYKKSKPILTALVLYLVSLYPFYFVIVNALSENLTGRGLAPSIDSLKSLPIGWIGFVLLIAWGIYSLFKYLTLKKDDTIRREWLIPAVYSVMPALFLGIGQLFHGYQAFLFLTVLAIALIGIALYRHINWLMLIGLGSISMVILGSRQFLLGLAVGIAAVIIIGLIVRNKSWKTVLSLILLGIIGYSVHLYIPIRSAHNPNIDENNPSESITTLANYLDRKQYGHISMTERMFVRRAEWGNQFGDYRRMGFWRFFKDQYGLTGPRFFIVLILGLFGIWETIRRKPDIGLPFLFIVILSSIGLVLYMNFADGTRQTPTTPMDYIEVRNRDYFFTPAFVFFGLAIGMGIAGFIDLVRDSFAKSSVVMRNTAFGISSLLVLTPLFPLANNYFENDRSRNYMPYDYAYNYLNSCEKDAILITSGDNDTFPIWCIQEVYGFRRDVRAINLSLANTSWYAKQLRDRFNVPITLTDQQIEALRPYRDKDGVGHRIQEQLVDHIITANKWKYPIYFVVSTPEDTRVYRGKPLEDYLVLEGMVLRLYPQKDQPNIDYELTRKRYEEEYIYRGINDPTIFKSETSERLTNNYAQGFLFLADTLRRAGDFEGALQHIRNGMEIFPGSQDIYLYTSQLLGELGRLDTLESFIDDAPFEDKRQLYFNWALSAKMAGRVDEAIDLLEKTHEMYPDYAEAFQALARTYYQYRHYAKLRTLVEDWVSRHPEDTESKQLLQQIRGVDRSYDSLEERSQ